MFLRRMIALLALGSWVAGPVLAETWESRLELGMSLNDGTSDTLDLHAALTTIRETGYDRLGFLLRGAYGDADGEATTQKGLAEARYNHTFTPLYFWSLLGSVEHDRFRDIDFRSVIGPGIGVHAIRNAPTFLDLEAGIVYIHSDYSEAKDEDQIHWRFGNAFRTRFNETVSFTQRLEWMPEIDDFGEYLVRFEAALSVAMSQAMSLNLRLVDDYDSDPPEGIQKNNLAVYATLGWTF